MSSLIHSSYYRPRIFPLKNDVSDAEIDRVQSIDPTITMNRDKVEEVGRDGVVGYLKKSPTIGYRMVQLEYGNIEFWQKLVNTATKGASGQDAITQNDFKNAYFDICAYLTDDDGTFKGTIYYPSLRTSGFSLNLGSPQDRIERNFDLVGESAIIWQGDNKYFIYHRHEAGSGGDNEIDLSAKAPAVDPDEAGKYMQRVIRVSSGVTTELTTSDYSYSNSTKILTINSITAGDVIKVYYTSATAPDTIFSNNDSDVATMLGDSVSIYMYIPGSGKPSSSDYLYKLQSATIDVAFDREDVRELGNKNVVARGIRSTDVTVRVGQILEDFTIQEILRGEASGYGKIDVEKLSDEITLIVQFFSDNTKDTFKYEVKCTNLTPSEIRGGAAVNDYVRKDNSFIGESISISADSTL